MMVLTWQKMLTWQRTEVAKIVLLGLKIANNVVLNVRNAVYSVVRYLLVRTIIVRVVVMISSIVLQLMI